MDEAFADVRVGHWTHPGGQTGCTVVLFPDGTVASGEVRGGAPATREFALLDPRRSVQNVDAVVLTGGSAFGLATADGVSKWLAARNRGFPTRVGPVPIVIALGLFDLDDGVPRPGAADGVAAADAAGPVELGGVQLGAGAGATVSKWRGRELRKRGGLGIARIEVDDVATTAVIAVNASGDIDDGSVTRDMVAGTFELPTLDEPAFENTTIGVVWTNASVDKLGCRLLAESAHDGLGRALMPAHTESDGDAIVAASVGAVDAPLRLLRTMVTVTVEQAIRSVA